MRFISGHNGTQFRPRFDDAEPFKIDGDYCKLLPLSRGIYHVVDASEYDFLSKIAWTADLDQTTGNFYAFNRRFGKLHRYLLGLKKGDPRTGDHIDPSRTWDNRRNNLRIADFCQQQQNRQIYKNNTSGYKGVSWSKDRQQYVALIQKDGKRHFLGSDPNPCVCAQMYRVAALEMHGEFARTS